MVRLILLLTWLIAGQVAAQDECDKAAFSLAIDIGHTPGRPGALSASGRVEYAFNKDLATELKAAFAAQGFKQVFLVNPQGREIALRDRTRIAQTKNADLFLSLHHDSVQPHYLSTGSVEGKKRRYSDRFHGYSLFISEKHPNSVESRRFAELLGDALLEQGMRPTLHHAEKIPGENRHLADENRGIYFFDELAVLKSAQMPAVLLEAGVIVNRDEEKLLRRPAHRQRIIDAVMAAVKRYCLPATPRSDQM